MNDSARVVFIEEPIGGWFAPWPSVFELSQVLSEENWVLVGGLMVQAKPALPIRAALRNWCREDRRDGSGSR